MKDVIDLMLDKVREKGLNTAISKRKDGVWVIAVHPDEKDMLGSLQAAILLIMNREMPIVEIDEDEKDATQPK